MKVLSNISTLLQARQ